MITVIEVKNAAIPIPRIALLIISTQNDVINNPAHPASPKSIRPKIYGFLGPILSMILPNRGLKIAMKSPWVVMIRPAVAGLTPNPLPIQGRTGAMIEPAMTVTVAEARITHMVYFSCIFIFIVFFGDY